MTLAELKKLLAANPRSLTRKQFYAARKAFRAITTGACHGTHFVNYVHNKPTHELVSAALWEAVWGLIGGGSMSPWGLVLFKAENGDLQYSIYETKANNLLCYNSRGNSRRFVFSEDFARMEKIVLTQSHSETK